MGVAGFMPEINIRYPVARLRQPDDDNDCWATAIAVITYRHSIDGINHVKALARANGVPVTTEGKLPPESILGLARSVHLFCHDIRFRGKLSVAFIARLMARGPIAAFGLFKYAGAVYKEHAVALYQLVGTGTREGTKIYVMDPQDGRSRDFKFSVFDDVVATIDFIFSRCR
jgi:hypothetical protein